jgi:prefoldin subunit 5
MTITKQTLEEQVEELALRLQRVEIQLEELTSQAKHVHSVSAAQAEKAGAAAEESGRGEEEISEEMLSWVGQSSFLPGVATLGVLLVIALILRTLPDSHLVSSFLGSVLGELFSSPDDLRLA